MKRTWKKRGLGHDHIREVVRTSRSLSEAARTLNVDRSTLHRWLEADPSLKEPIRERRAAEEDAVESCRVLTPDEWVERMEGLHKFSDTARITLDLARRALEIARDEYAKPGERLQAMGRFQNLVESLYLERPQEEPKPEKKPPDRPIAQKDPRLTLRVV